MNEEPTTQEPVFVRGNDHLDRLLSDPLIGSHVAAAHADAEEMDSAYAMNLAMAGKAAQLTQADSSASSVSAQAAVSLLKGREDMLLSTLHGPRTEHHA